MKKALVIATAFFFLAGAGWSQPLHRRHTRPPYSGPMKSAKIRSKVRRHPARGVHGKGAFPKNKAIHGH